MFGPCVSARTVVWRRDDHSVALGLTRLTSVREPFYFGLCERLFQLQAIFIQTHRPLLAMYADRAIRIAWPHYGGALAEERQHFDDPHPKRALRREAFFRMCRSGEGIYGNRLRLGRVELSLKVEVAKWGKVPRCVADLGVDASMIGAWLANAMKITMHDFPYDTPQLFMWYCPTASYQNLLRAFGILQYPRSTWTVVLFSDDACLAYYDGSTVVYYDLDISSCDKSHGLVLFELLYLWVPQHLHVELTFLLEQLQGKLRVRSVANRRSFVDLLPRQPVLYSGSVLTTVVNNLAVMLIGIAISQSPGATVALIQQAAQRAGYLVTVKQHTKFEELQFLKHSPVWDGQKWVPVLNIGVLLRASGTCKYDLPGSGPLEPRARQFQAALIQGMYPYTHSPFLELMRQNCHVSRVEEIYIRQVDKLLNPFVQKTYSEGEHHYVTDENLFARYRATSSDLADLHEFARSSGFGTSANFSILSRILATDYNLSTRNAPISPEYDRQFLSRLLSKA